MIRFHKISKSFLFTLFKTCKIHYIILRVITPLNCSVKSLHNWLTIMIFLYSSFLYQSCARLSNVKGKALYLCNDVKHYTSVNELLFSLLICLCSCSVSDRRCINSLCSIFSLLQTSIIRFKLFWKG